MIDLYDVYALIEDGGRFLVTDDGGLPGRSVSPLELPNPLTLVEDAERLLVRACGLAVHPNGPPYVDGEHIYFPCDYTGEIPEGYYWEDPIDPREVRALAWLEARKTYLAGLYAPPAPEEEPEPPPVVMSSETHFIRR